MKLERSKVDYPLWRKKVDSSLFQYSGTPIPTWACNMWEINGYYKDVTSKDDPKSRVNIKFHKKSYNGWIVLTRKGRKKPLFRLWFTDELSYELKHTFVMSYMRTLEGSLRKKASSIEDEISFWEFLDIEYDVLNKTFLFCGHYIQKASFPELFRRIISSPKIKQIDREIIGKKDLQIDKQDWKPREELKYEVRANNAIYFLIDTKRKLLYVGETDDLVRRLSQPYTAIPNWDYFRYDVLPNEFAPSRVLIERMLITDYAYLLRNNRKEIKCISISDYKLANEKIDKK